MHRREAYRHRLPHFQQPGQAYFVTWSLNDAVPQKVVDKYLKKRLILPSQIKVPLELNVQSGAASSDSPGNCCKLNVKLLQNQEYYIQRKKYLKAYNDYLDNNKHPEIDLSEKESTREIIETLNFWNGKKLFNIAYCIMPNHVHWVLHAFNKDLNDTEVFLQDIMQSVKRFSANTINKIEKRKGKLWQRESFDTTIRNEYHLYRAINYTLNNPVKAGLSKDWANWKGCWCEPAYLP